MWGILRDDGAIEDIGIAKVGERNHEVDEAPALPPPGTRIILDPDNPRRAIVAPPPESTYTYAEQRAAEYPSMDALTVALWERVVEGRPEASAVIQAQREAIKAKWPKPGASAAGAPGAGEKQ